MDFFERQDRARRGTHLLVIYFAAGVLMLTLAIYVAALFLFGIAGGHHHSFGAPSTLILWKPKLFATVALGTLAVIAIGSLSKTLELSQGGSVVASSLGGRPVNPTTTDPDERKLLNVVEEMAIASGVPVPQVYVLPSEPGINAFAAGHTPSDAVVAVTGGALRVLSRDELQGVIAHEFSHILNGDMRLNLRLMGAVFGILCLAVIGRVLLQVRGGSRDKNPLPFLGLALIVVGWAGVFFGRLIQAAVSRQREFLADASAVQFTRNPAGLAGALKKIGGLSTGSRLRAPQADAASHMFFGNGRPSALFHLLDTHPPLAERILAIDPAFDGVFPETADLVPAQPELPPGRVRAARATPFPGLPPIIRTAPIFAATAGIAPANFTARAGVPTTAHLRYAEGLRKEIPEALQAATQESLGATALVYGLLLNDDPAARNKQLEELAVATSQAMCQETLRLLPDIQLVASRAKLPLVDLALPALRQMSPRQFQEFDRALKALVESDGEIDLFEYVLQKIVLRHLEPLFQPARRPVLQFYALKPFIRDGAVLLSALAYLGQKDPGEVTAAFQRGAGLLSAFARVEVTMVPEAQCDLASIDAALDRLNQAVPQIKKNLLDACAETVAADGLIQEMEIELLRAIADALGCPLPPFIADPVCCEAA